MTTATLTNTEAINWPHPTVQAAWEANIYEQGCSEPGIQQAVSSLLVASHAKTVLELGTFLGLTTTWLAVTLELMGGGTLIGVEMDYQRAEATRLQLDQLSLPRVKLDIWQADSISALKELKPHSIDFCWVDDDHGAKHVAEELQLLCNPTLPSERRMANGGLVLMHDVSGPLGLDGVCSAFHGLPLDFPRLGPAGGLGIIQIP